MLTCNFIKKGFIVDVLLGIDGIFHRSIFHQHLHERYPRLLRTSKSEKFAIIVDGYKPLTIVAMLSIKDDRESAAAVTRRCSVKKVFLQISQNSQKNTYA